MNALAWDRIAQVAMHPLQVLILDALADGRETSPIEMADEFGEKLPNLSYHVRRLHAQGLITATRTEPRRGAIKHFYRLADLAVANTNGGN